MSYTYDYVGRTYNDFNGKKIRNDFAQILENDLFLYNLFDDEIILHPDGMSCEEEIEGGTIGYDILPDIVISLDKDNRVRDVSTEYHVVFESKDCDVNGMEWLPKEEVHELMDSIIE